MFSLTHYPLFILLIGPLVVITAVDSFAVVPKTFFNLKSPELAARASSSTITTKIMSSNNIELPSPEVLDKLLSVAIDASKQAGEIILGNSGGADVLKSKANSRDLLTLIDPLCEKVRVAVRLMLLCFACSASPSRSK